MIKILDTTLRDGGHVINYHFGHALINDIVCSLKRSHCDIIELGCLMNKPYKEDYSVYNRVKQAAAYIDHQDSTEYSLLVQQDWYDPHLLEDYDGGKLKHIRVSFHSYDIEEGFEFARIVKDKGYEIHINPINFSGYSMDGMKAIIDAANELCADTFSIVDTFGSLDYPALMRIAHIADERLEPHIGIGLHLHENLASSLVLAQIFIDLYQSKRNLSIDGALTGMGRIPGNCPTELLMLYANKNMNGHYDISEILHVIHSALLPLKEKFNWGYSVPYALAAVNNIHRSYAEFALNQKMNMREVYRYLNSLSEAKKTIWDSRYADEMASQIKR